MKKTGWLTSKTVRRHLSLKARIMKARPPHGLAPRPASHNAIFLAAEGEILSFDSPILCYRVSLERGSKSWAGSVNSRPSGVSTL